LQNPYITVFFNKLMENEADSIKQFITKFFENLQSTVIEKGDSLVISNVPEKFEKFYGKKSPYIFVFKSEDKNSQNEFIEKGNYLLKTISNFLEEQGSTTLLKINFDIDFEKEIKKRIKLNNCQIEKLIPKKKNNFFFRFTFNTSFQYLNEKEKMTNDIYLYENKIIDGDLASYIITEGNKRDVIMPDIKEPYNIAKEKVKELIQPKITLLAKNLSEKLSKEIERINRHFIQETQELKNNLKKSTKKTEKEINEELEKKINEFEKDKERAINIEKQKHSLNLNTKLFNTTLIYYPVLNYDCYLINEHGKRIIEVSFDPLTKELKQIFCESCEDKIETINLCSSGHIICNKCLIKCNSCNITYCNKCLNIICESCKKKICKKCAIRCNNCSKVMCKDHAIYDKVTDKCYCSSCLKLCERCQHKKESNRFKTSQKTGAEICEDCYRLEMQQKTLKEIFKK